MERELKKIWWDAPEECWGVCDKLQHIAGNNKVLLEYEKWKDEYKKLGNVEYYADTHRYLLLVTKRHKGEE